MRAARVPFGKRAAWALAVVVLVAIIYGICVAAKVAPLPSTVAAIAASGAPGPGPRLVDGYYVSQPFTSLGSGLPPYVFATDTKAASPSIHVTPTLADVRAGRVVAIVDTSTGDGSRWSPDVIRTVASWPTFVAGIAIGAIVLIIFALWLGGILAARRPLTTGMSAGAPQKQT